MSDFPSSRFLAAGATPEEVAFLEDAFETRSDAEKAAALDFYGSVADADIRERVESMREAGLLTHADEPAPTSSVAPEPPTVAPSAPPVVSEPSAPPVAPPATPQPAASNAASAPGPVPSGVPVPSESGSPAPS